jgi:predicted transcriptional regulator
MAKTVGDLKLDDEHSTIGLDDTLQEGAKRLITVQNGILVVLDDDQQVKGVLGTKQFLKAFADGKDSKNELCKDHMEMDFLLVHISEKLDAVLEKIKNRQPQAVVAVDDDYTFVGYLSTNDYQEAQNLVSNLKNLRL